MSAPLYWTLTALLVVVLLLIGLWAYQTATRLNRLHVRYDLSWQALDGALARRAVVARAVAADAYRHRPQGRQLAALADAAERAPRPAREAAENELSAALAIVDPSAIPVALVAELADAEARVLLARRFHNDAVRDTLALRERRPVRWLRLGGTAPLPNYFEIAERAAGAAGPATSDGETAVPPTEAGLVDRRTSARVVLLDDEGSVLLFCGSDPAVTDGTAPRWWFTVGGQAHPGERLVDTAVREIAEETGLRVDPARVVGPVWRRDSVIDFNGTVIGSQEFYFIHRTSRFEPTTGGRTPLELRYIHGHRWCDSATIEKLAAGGETVYPLQLGELLAEANAVADGRGGGPPRELHRIR
ncbi:MAG: NUDIX domain-containing protein [Mycolicibacterium sp.]|nr:NUDIX domain-containing protein [Mycobacterium sp.]MCB9417200.1 NUDIX domain-containing protein [Mycolicibacterium sp.]